MSTATYAMAPERLWMTGITNGVIVSDTLEEFLSFLLGEGRVNYQATAAGFTGKKPKEQALARAYLDLVEIYGYAMDRIGVKVKVTSRRAADMVVYSDEDHTIPYLLVESCPIGSSRRHVQKCLYQAADKAWLLRAPYAAVLSGVNYMVVKFDSAGKLVRLEDMPVASK